VAKKEHEGEGHFTRHGVGANNGGRAKKRRAEYAGPEKVGGGGKEYNQKRSTSTKNCVTDYNQKPGRGSKTKPRENVIGKKVSTGGGREKKLKQEVKAWEKTVDTVQMVTKDRWIQRHEKKNREKKEGKI